MSRHYTINNKEYPSVTTILELMAKPALYGFYAKYGWKKAKAIAKEAGDTGSQVHEHIHGLLTSQYNIVYKDNEGFINAVENFNEFNKKYKPKPISLEMTVHSHKYKYAGTLDGVVKIGKKVVMLDWKTSSAIYPEYEMQLNAYYQALTERSNDGIIKEGCKVNELWIVRLDKKKKMVYSKDVLKLKPDNDTFKAFLGLLELYNWKQRRK